VPEGASGVKPDKTQPVQGFGRCAAARYGRRRTIEFNKLKKT